MKEWDLEVSEELDLLQAHLAFEATFMSTLNLADIFIYAHLYIIKIY